MINTLIQLQEVEISENDLGQPFAPYQEEAIRLLQDCSGQTVELLNSGYSDFQAEPLPDGHGSITGVLLKDGNHFQLIIRDVSDVDFSGTRCEAQSEVRASDRIFISELADPDNNADARFVELYYSGAEELALTGWKLLRYTNANEEISSSIDLSELRMLPGSTLVIAADALIFEATYGFAPNLEGGSNGPADSNGDDNLVLLDPFGTVVDVFGVIGEDGSGTNHEFEDGRALRRPTIRNGNPTFTFSEWEVFNDSGLSGTTLAPQNAPENFSPGMH